MSHISQHSHRSSPLDPRPPGPLPPQIKTPHALAFQGSKPPFRRGGPDRFWRSLLPPDEALGVLLDVQVSETPGLRDDAPGDLTNAPERTEESAAHRGALQSARNPCWWSHEARVRWFGRLNDSGGKWRGKPIPNCAKKSG